MTTRFKTITLALSVATIAIGGFAYAQANNDSHDMHMMRGMDPDGNGVVTRAEAQQAASAMFTRLDANKDGKLDQADRDAHRAEMRGRIFTRLDANNDGSISKTEFMADKFMAGRGPEGNAPGGPGMDGHEMGRHGRHGMRGHHGGMMGMARMADTDNNGAISQAEFTTAAMKHFDMADADHDGKITAGERKAAHEKMRAEWRAQKPAAPAR
jgi:Ca2+-binding EF-hand superfamily protein